MSERMEKFSDCHTRWEGLWYHPESHNYTSAALNLASLKGFKGTCRLRMYKNLKKGDNQPTYLFTISSTSEDEVEELEIQRNEHEPSLEDKVAELKEIMRRGSINGNRIELPSVSQSNAAHLMGRAIDIIEEITGEKWDFSYITW